MQQGTIAVGLSYKRAENLAERRERPPQAHRGAYLWTHEADFTRLSHSGTFSNQLPDGPAT